MSSPTSDLHSTYNVGRTLSIFTVPMSSTGIPRNQSTNGRTSLF